MFEEEREIVICIKWKSCRDFSLARTLIKKANKFTKIVRRIFQLNLFHFPRGASSDDELFFSMDSPLLFKQIH